MYELIFWTHKEKYPGDTALNIVSDLLSVSSQDASMKLSLGVIFGGVTLLRGQKNDVEEIERQGNELLYKAKSSGAVPPNFRFSVLNRAMPN